MIAPLAPLPSGPESACGIAGHAVCEARLSEIAALRDAAVPPGVTVPPGAKVIRIPAQAPAG